MKKMTTLIPALLGLTLVVACEDMGDAAYTDKRPTNINNLRTDRSIEQLLDERQALADERSPQQRLCLNNPADPAELIDVQAQLGQTFPEDMMRLYQHADGQRRDDDCVPLFVQGYWFLSLEDMVSAWQHSLDEHQGRMSTEAMYGRQGAVYGYHWHPSWIPVGFRSSGDFLMVDFVPTPMGASGQVIRYVADEEDRDHLAMGLAEYLAQVVDALEQNPTTPESNGTGPAPADG